MHTLVIFASGNGTNAAAIINYFRNNQKVQVGLVVTNKENAGVIGIANNDNIPVKIIGRELFESAEIIEHIRAYKPALIVLAGFLWKVPIQFIKAFPGAIVNIHPALLPQHGGKGMYGARVHEAVISTGATETGITIHFVDEEYDAGAIIVQARCKVSVTDTPDTLATKVHHLEHFFYPRTIEYLLRLR